MQSFKYSIVRYMPDPRRGEIVNVGLVVFLDEKLDVRLINNSAKIRIIDGSSGIEDLEKLKNFLEEIRGLAGSTDLSLEMIKSFHGPSFLSEPANFFLDHLSQYEDKVNSLFNTLVKPFASKERAVRNTRIHTQIKEQLESMDLLGKSNEDLSRHKMIYNYPINEKTGFTADFLLKNGRYHITEVIDYNVNDLNSKFKETSMKVMAFMEGKKALGNDTASYFVYSATSSIEKEIFSHLNLASDYSDVLFNIDRKQDRKNYYELVSSLAGQGALIH